MTEYYYRFDDEAAAKSALADYTEAGSWMLAGDGFCLDPVGLLTDGAEPAELLEGWHLNLRVTDGRPAPAQEYLIEPEHPRRVWA